MKELMKGKILKDDNKNLVNGVGDASTEINLQSQNSNHKIKSKKQTSKNVIVRRIKSGGAGS